jgi:hypothetical protein
MRRVILPPPTAGPRVATAHSRTWVSDIFLASLFADAVVTMLADAHAAARGWRICRCL